MLAATCSTATVVKASRPCDLACGCLSLDVYSAVRYEEEEEAAAANTDMKSPTGRGHFVTAPPVPRISLRLTAASVRLSAGTYTRLEKDW